MNRFEFLLSWTIIPITIVLGLFCQKIVSFAAYPSVNLHFMKVSTENDNNIGYEKITILVDKMPLRTKNNEECSLTHYSKKFDGQLLEKG
jgi:hypothetical protein